jgi:hypothetical protein
MSPRCTPAQVSDRAQTSAQASMSRRVYPTTVIFPVVPEEAWIRETSSSGTAKSPKG